MLLLLQFLIDFNNKSSHLLFQRYKLILANSSYNDITNNNFFKNYSTNPFPRNVLFYDSNNIWNQNYWNRPRLLPKPIFGKTGSFHKVEFDWNPAKKPKTKHTPGYIN